MSFPVCPPVPPLRAAGRRKAGKSLPTARSGGTYENVLHCGPSDKNTQKPVAKQVGAGYVKSKEHRLQAAGGRAHTDKKEPISEKPVPLWSQSRRTMSDLLGGYDRNLDVGEHALVALYLALELSELLDVGNRDVLALHLDAGGCENLGDLG